MDEDAVEPCRLQLWVLVLLSRLESVEGNRPTLESRIQVTHGFGRMITNGPVTFKRAGSIYNESNRSRGSAPSPAPNRLLGHLDGRAKLPIHLRSKQSLTTNCFSGLPNLESVISMGYVLR